MTRILEIPGIALVQENARLNIDSFSEKENTNKARAQGHDDLHVKRLETSLKHGWDDSQPRPIAIQNEFGKPVLVDGHHRRDAWRRLGHTTLPVDYYKLTGICSLDSIIAKIGLKANDHKPSKPVTLRDVERIVQRRIEDEDLDVNVDEIHTMLKDLDLKNNISDSQLVKSARTIWEKTNSSEQVTSVGKNQIEKFEREHPQLQVCEWHTITGDKSNQSTYLLRIVADVCKKYSGSPLSVGLYAQKVNSMQHLWKVRTDAVDQMEALFDSIREAAMRLPKGKYPWSDPVAFPQLESEMESMDIVKIGRY